MRTDDIKSDLHTDIYRVKCTHCNLQFTAINGQKCPKCGCPDELNNGQLGHICIEKIKDSEELRTIPNGYDSHGNKV